MEDVELGMAGRGADVPPPDRPEPTVAELEALFALAPDDGWRAEAGFAPPPADADGVGGDPIDRAVVLLQQADRAMAGLLRELADASPAHGLPARRHVGLRTGTTDREMAFLERVVQTLGAMPRTQAAFDEGTLSWSQVRGIALEARRLSVASRRQLDDLLAGAVADARDRGEPERVVEIAGDLVARLDPAGQERREREADRTERVVLQPGFDGWADIHGTLSPVTTAAVSAALDAAADAPVAPDDPPITDDDGQLPPAAAQRPPSRGWQWAQALRRVCEMYLGGGGPVGPCTCDATAHAEGCQAGIRRRARPSMIVVVSLAELAGHAAGLAPDSVTARLLLRRGSGRRRITRALSRQLLQDADVISLFTDAAGIPVAIGDSHDPISPALRRAVLARDQGCRAPGCTAPAEHCDINHIVPRELGGPTSLINLGGFCRSNHTCLTDGRWTMTMDPDGTMHFRIGQHTYVTRPRLRPPS